MDQAERAVAIRRFAVRWGTVALAALVLLAFWRLFVLVCPLRDWPVLGWSLGRADAAAWNAPQIPALVAENALENGGAVGIAVGRRLYAKTLAPAAASPQAQDPPAYASLRLPYAWEGETGRSWCVEPWSGQTPVLSMNISVPLQCPALPPAATTALVRVFVQARLAEPVGSGGCAETQPVPAGIERDYLVVRTAAGWRVADVYMVDPGLALVNVQPVGAGTPEALLAGCG